MKDLEYKYEYYGWNWKDKALPSFFTIDYTLQVLLAAIKSKPSGRVSTKSSWYSSIMNYFYIFSLIVLRKEYLEITFSSNLTFSNPWHLTFLIISAPNIFDKIWWPKQMPKIFKFRFYIKAFCICLIKNSISGTLSETEWLLPGSIIASALSNSSYFGYFPFNI